MSCGGGISISNISLYRLISPHLILLTLYSIYTALVYTSVYYAPYTAKGRLTPKAMNGQGWVGCIYIFFPSYIYMFLN